MRNKMPHSNSRDCRTNTILLALRAGPMLPEELADRFGGNSCNYTSALSRGGLIKRVGLFWHITEKGRRAVRPRNPASTTARQFPKQGPHVNGPTGQPFARRGMPSSYE